MNDVDTSKIYYDSDDNECSILQMVKREPEWAANRVQEGEKAQAEIDELKQENRLMWQRLPEIHQAYLISAYPNMFDKHKGE